MTKTSLAHPPDHHPPPPPIVEDFDVEETYYAVFFPQARRMAQGNAGFEAVRLERGTVRTPAHPYLGDG
jgi:hypothetical protein